MARTASSSSTPPVLADPVTTAYTYDDANRLTTASGQTYSFDANGNLLSDGTYTYSYDTANRLVGVSSAATAVTYRYNGDGNRVQQTTGGTTTNYTLELNSGLSQVLADGTNTYLYGMNRLGMSNTAGYYLYEYDALGSVRQMENIAGITLAESYDPYGNVILSSGQTGIFGYTGEEQANGLVYLRARTYNPYLGIFTSRDTWDGDVNSPMSYNRWMYSYGNPVKYTDPSGMSVACGNGDTGACGGETKESKYFNERKFYENCAKYGGSDCPPWGEIIIYTALGLAGVAVVSDIICPVTVLSAGETAQILCFDGNCTNEIDVTIRVGQDIWKYNPFDRGRIIEEQLGRTPNLVYNFPTIDRWANGIATSIKTINLNSSTYQNPTTLYRVLCSYVDKVANFNGVNWGGTVIEEYEIVGRELVIGIPYGYNYMQMQALMNAYGYAQSQGVKLIYVYVR